MKPEAALREPHCDPASWDGTLPASAPSLGEARRYCEWLARTHYENFPVATLLLPAGVRPHFYSIYAYCRWSDDLGDELNDPSGSLQLLDLWELELRACYEGRARHPVFVALRQTVEECRIPPEPFHDLITAFRRDQTQTRYQTFEELLGYCRYSANPVGRLILYACGYGDPELQQLSDCTCTALQLANFWQDVRRDFGIGRIYIPREEMARWKYSEEELAAFRYNDAFKEMMRSLVQRTWSLFDKGMPLADRVDRRLAFDIELFSRGGMEILRLIERQNYDVLTHRPQLDSARTALLVGTTAMKRVFHLWRPSADYNGSMR